MYGNGRKLFAVFVSVLLYFYVSWDYFRSANTMNTKYRIKSCIPKPEYLTKAHALISEFSEANALKKKRKEN